MLPYASIVLLTLVLAVIATHVVSAAAREESASTRTTLVAVTFLGVYMLMFVARYFLLDRLFARLASSDIHPDAHPAPHPAPDLDPVNDPGETS